jgi:hypothetical protein
LSRGFSNFFLRKFSARKHDYLPASIYGIPTCGGSTGTVPLDTYYYTRIFEKVKCFLKSFFRLGVSFLSVEQITSVGGILVC